MALTFARSRSKNFSRLTGPRRGCRRGSMFDGENVAGVESFVDVQQSGEAGGKETGDDQQRRAQADFEADQAFAKAQAAASFGDGVASGAQRFLRIAAGKPPGGKHAEHKPGEQREAEANTRTLESRRTSFEPGNFERRRGDEQLYVQPANRIPRAPPETASSRLSVSTWRNWRPRLAPRAVRIAASRLRDAIRESRRLARLTQTMSRTAPTAAASIHKPSRARPVTSSCTGMSVAHST